MDTPEYWSNTLAAQAGAYQGLSEIHYGSFFISLALILGLLLLLAWGLRRLGLLKPGASAAASGEDRVVFYSRFNARQTLVVMTSGRVVRCLILNDQDVELAADVPGVKPEKSSAPETNPSAGRGVSFGEIWRAVRARGKQDRT